MSRLDWSRDGADWPNRACSSFVTAGVLRWHVQRVEASAEARGQCPRVLLVHGTGASTHSWRDNLRALGEHADVLACDLPGHGFTERPAADRLSLPAMAHQLGQLLEACRFKPDIVIGHSAGAAILVRMTLDGQITPRAIISLNGALYPFEGRTQRTFPSIARALFLNPLVPRVFALGAGSPKRVARLIEGTGSVIDSRGLDLYGRLFACSDHAAAALGMMARWDLDKLDADIERLAIPLWLVVGDQDKAVPPGRAEPLVARLSYGERVCFDGLGHLAHEEAPARINTWLIDRIREANNAAFDDDAR